MEEENDFDIIEIISRLEKASIEHNIQINDLNKIDEKCNEFLVDLNRIHTLVENEKKYIENKIKEEEEKKKKEEEERKKKEEEERKNIMNKSHNHIDDVIKELKNNKQIEILNRVKLRRLDDQMYYINFEKNYNVNKQVLLGTFTILGTLNKNGVRSEYSVDMYDPELYEAPKKIFNCDCPAHKFQSGKDNVVCKHIAFVMCRVVGYITTDFFTNHRLTKDEVNMIMDKMSLQRETIILNVEMNRMKDNCVGLKPDQNNVITIKRNMMTKENFLNSTRTIDEDCPICFDVIEHNNNRINCPECKKHIHKECMEIWLSKNNTCVYCRSKKWTHYKKCFIENKSVELTGEEDDEDY